MHNNVYLFSIYISLKLQTCYVFRVETEVDPSTAAGLRCEGGRTCG